METGRIPTVNWESSSPPRPKLSNLNQAFTGEATPKQNSLPRLAPSSDTAAAHDPVDELLDKYHVAPLLSSPPPTWPIRTAQPAKKFNSEYLGTKRPTDTSMRLYSPGYLKRPRAPLPPTPLKPRKTVNLPILDSDDDDLDLSTLKKESVPPVFDEDDDIDFGTFTAAKPTAVEQSVVYPFLPDPVIEFKDSPLEVTPLVSNCHRFLVEFVNVEELTTTIQAKGTKGTVVVTLKDIWCQMEVCRNDVIHIIGEIDESEPITISNASKPLLVLNPDVLVACTSVADSMNCERQVVLRSRLRIPGEANVAMLYGNILHELIQICLLESNFDLEGMKVTLKNSIIDEYVEDLMILELDIKTALEEIYERLPPISEWGNRMLCGGKPQLKAAIHRSTRELPVKITATGVVEEELWSPTYGLKGKVDATVAVSTGGPSVVTALEIKTGAATGYSSTSHRAQIMLYSLLLQERYEKVLPWMLLYYAKDGAMIAVRGMADEMRQLLLRRNILVRHMSRPARLPWHTPMSLGCKFCFRKDDCTVFTAANEEHLDPCNSGQPTAQSLIESAPGTWTRDQLAFFQHWDKLLVYEDLESNRRTKDIWCVDAETRELNGKAIAGVKIVLKSLSGTKIKPWYTYVCSREDPFPDAGQTLLLPRAPVVVSSAKAVAEAQGFIDLLSPTAVEITVDHALDENVTFRLDHEDGHSFLSMGKYNLLRIFTQRSRLLELVVDLKAPKFDLNRSIQFPPGLNSDQEAAMRKVAQAKDYVCILGMPGTGKTTTIVSIARALLAEGKSVFISAVTHSAVDNIVLKLLRYDVDVLRIGSSSRINPQIARKMAAREEAIDPAADAATRLERLYLNAPVVAATCLSTNHWLFSRRHFDVCILDEASQVMLPTCLGPLRHADRFVLVGDHYQLQPIVRSALARENGLENSLFKRLCDAHPDAVANLSHQYRMNQDIMNLSSTLIYNGMLRCGSDEVANQRLVLPKKVNFAPPWIEAILNPANSVIFLNTDMASAPEEERSDGYANPKEAKIIFEIVRNLIDAGGIAQANVGVISVYRAQLKLLKERLASYKDLDVLTADQAQGRDKDCIIMSLVRSNNDQRVGDLLRDWRRINVCFTRAKSKLVIVGSHKTLISAPTLEKFLKVIEANGWMHNA